MQAQKVSKPRPAAAFALHESEGMQDLLSLMQNMSMGGAAGEADGHLPQANGDLSSHARDPEGAPCVSRLCHLPWTLEQRAIQCVHVA